MADETKKPDVSPEAGASLPPVASDPAADLDDRIDAEYADDDALLRVDAAQVIALAAALDRLSDAQVQTLTGAIGQATTDRRDAAELILSLRMAWQTVQPLLAAFGIPAPLWRNPTAG